MDVRRASGVYLFLQPVRILHSPLDMVDVHALRVLSTCSVLILIIRGIDPQFLKAMMTRSINSVGHTHPGDLSGTGPSICHLDLQSIQLAYRKVGSTCSKSCVLLSQSCHIETICL